jgi:hypothetical protein
MMSGRFSARIFSSCAPEHVLLQGLPVHKIPAGRKALAKWLLNYSNAKECLHTAKLAAENRAAQKRSHSSFMIGD